jgi:hypothetical protein
MKSLPDIARHFSACIERGKGIRLEAADLDILASIGVNELVQRAAAEYLRDQSRERIAKRQGGGNAARSIDPTSQEDVEALLAEARLLTGRTK